MTHTLHVAGIEVMVVNPAQLFDYEKSLSAQTKTDARDALVIARYGTSATLRVCGGPGRLSCGI